MDKDKSSRLDVEGSAREQSSTVGVAEETCSAFQIIEILGVLFLSACLLYVASVFMLSGQRGSSYILLGIALVLYFLNKYFIDWAKLVRCLRKRWSAQK